MPDSRYICGRVRTDCPEQFAETLANLATNALTAEVCITPKPGLVDCANSGAHHDMDIFTFMDSALALYPYFRKVTVTALSYTGAVSELLAVIQPLGIQAETDMFTATHGVNTHKGAVFSLGVMCAAVGIIASRPDQYTNAYASLSELCVTICRAKARTTAKLATKGQGVYQTYGLTGILGEAAAGYPNVFELALPTLERYIAQGIPLQEAGVMTLLQLLTVVQDTNIVARHDIATLHEVQARVKQDLQTCTTPQTFIHYAQTLDQQFIKRNISPGGCADLLALAIFVHRVFHAPTPPIPEKKQCHQLT